MATVTRGKITRGDLANWDGKNATAARPDATGGTVTGLAVGTEVDVLQVFGQGTSRTRGTISQALQWIGSTACTLVFSPGTWTIDDDLTVPENFTSHIPRGCIFNISADKTLTFSGPVLAESSIVNSGDGEIVGVAEEGIHNAFYPRTAAEIAETITPANYQYQEGNVLRYKANTDPGTTDMTPAFLAAKGVIEQAGRGTFRVPAGTYKVTSEIEIPDTSNVTLEIDAGAIIDCSSVASSSTDAMFVFGSVTEGQTTTISSAITKGATSIAVASSTGFAAGDMCALVSDDEYWGGETGASGFGRKTKGELVFIQSITDSTNIVLETEADESYSITGFTVSLIKLPKIENINIRCDGKFIGDGGGTDHTSSNPTGMRAFKIRCAVNVDVSGATFENFPRVACEFQLCSGVKVHGNTFIGRKLNDSTNLPNISLWFTGAFFLGCDGVDFLGNTGMFCRRHYDPDSFNALSTGMVIGRSHTVTGNTAIACLEPVGAHAVKNVIYTGNIGRGCYRGGAFRGRDVKFIANDFGHVEGDGILSIGGATNQGYSTTESPNVGHVVLIGNKGDAEARGLQISDDFESVITDNNTWKVGRAEGSEVGIGILVRSRRVDNLNIGNDVIDLTDRVDNAIGILFLNNSDARLSMNDVSIKAKIINPYIGISMSGTGDPDTEANNIHIDCRIVDAEHALVSLTGSGTFTDGDGFWGTDVAIKVSYSGAEPTNLLKMPADANKVRFRRRPSFEADRQKRFIGYGDASDLAAGETVSDGDYMYDPDTYTETYFTSDGTIGSDGGASVSISGGQSTGTLANGALMAKGQYVTIEGAGTAGADLDTTVTAKTVSTITFADAAVTTVAGANLNFINPTTATLVPS